MLNNNSVVFKGKKDGITILLDDKIDFEELREIFLEKMVDARNFFGGRKTPIKFQGRELTDEQESELLKLLADEANVNISFFISSPEETDVLQKSEQPLREPETDSPTDVLENQTKPNSYEQRTFFNAGALRSGQSINYPGTVVVIGDVNPGAEIIAAGNIIVLGAVKGFVHAGSAGDLSCFIYANELSPVQLRIADLITVIPKTPAGEKKFLARRKKIEEPAPSMAYISNGQIYIAQV